MVSIPPQGFMIKLLNKLTPLHFTYVYDLLSKILSIGELVIVNHILQFSLASSR